jgi:dTDP-4-dehydrorhamnose reductase
VRKTVLITGCAGQLGYRLIGDLSSHFNVIDTYRIHSDIDKKLDLESKQDFEHVFSVHNPDIIINCGALTNVDYCEKNKSHCHSVNVDGLSRILSFSHAHVKIIHISTDYVFDGFKGGYVEDAPTYPLNYYGKCKLESENMLIGSNREHLIFRVSMLFDSRGDNFFMWVVNELKKNNQIKVSTDIESNPTWIPSFSNAIMKSIYLDISGLFHYGTDKSLSRFEFAMLIAKRFNYNTDLIIPADSSDIDFKAQRPKNTSLVSSKLSDLIGVDIDNIDYVMKVLN